MVVENLFLLGDFGVRTVGWESTLIPPPKKLAYGSIVHQGLPFYGANITYQTTFDLETDCDIAIRTEYYKGSLLRIRIDGEDLGAVAFSPYTLERRFERTEQQATKKARHATKFSWRAFAFVFLYFAVTAPLIATFRNPFSRLTVIASHAGFLLTTFEITESAR